MVRSLQQLLPAPRTAHPGVAPADAENLERVLREAIADGQPRTHRPWTKILVMIEGVYSMEGEICNLPAILAASKKYKVHGPALPAGFRHAQSCLRCAGIRVLG